MSAADNQTTDDATLESDAVTEEILMDEPAAANFTTLKNDIANEENELKLERNYTYNYDDDHTYVPDEGIRIEKDNFVIDGQGYTINGAGSTRIFLVSAKNVTLKNINFINGHVDGNGGAIYWPGENGTIQNCNFTNNTASNGKGGAIYFNKNGIIENSNFTNNRARYASAIYLDNNAEANISNCRFTDNKAESYSTIHFNNGKGIVTNTYFENNTSTKGSGIYFGSEGKVENCTFSNNKLKGDYSWGSAIFFDYGYGWINNCNFTNNSGPVTIEFANYGYIV
ncbi:right-handed parallel beta-helix repeat-containing protein [Methanobrevibacter sp.]